MASNDNHLNMHLSRAQCGFAGLEPYFSESLIRDSMYMRFTKTALVKPQTRR